MKQPRKRRIAVRVTQEIRDWLEHLGGDTGVTGGFDWLVRVGKAHQADLARRRAIRNKERN